VKRVQGGESEVFGELVERYQQRVYTVVVGMVHRREDALDLAQEIFVKAYHSLKYFRGDSSFYTWLYRIAVNVVIDFRRKGKGIKPFSYEDGLVGEMAGGMAPPDQQVMTHELRQALHRALASLPHEQQAAIILRELEGLSYQEIADVVQCSIGTVMSRLHYARKRLQELLKPFL
jgi:RNA polymerase sigma-70 factor (ECF subfamily)